MKLVDVIRPTLMKLHAARQLATLDQFAQRAVEELNRDYYAATHPKGSLNILPIPFFATWKGASVDCLPWSM